MTFSSEPNLWRASSREIIKTHPLDRDASVDLVIIGGGFTGCAAALEAARRGATVCLLEAHSLGHGGSGRNVGLANAGLWLPPETIIAQVGKSAGEKLIALLGEAPARVYGLIERENIDCEATRNGTLHLAHAPNGLLDLQERCHQGLRYGAPLQVLDAEETARRTGTSAYCGALLDTRAGTVQPLAYCRGLARAAIAAGAFVFEGSPVTSLKREREIWRVESRGHSLRAKAVLVATNAYHFGITAPFEPHYVPVGYCQFATAPMSDTDRAKILPGGEGCWDTAMVMTSFRLDRAGRMILGAIGNSDGPGGPVHAAWARRKLKALFPSLDHMPFEHAWCGRIAMTGDHVPKIVAFGPDAYACFGYSGRGIGPGTVFGTQSAIALLDANPDALPLAPIAFYTEPFKALRATYYEAGATLMHAVNPSPFA